MSRRASHEGASRRGPLGGSHGTRSELGRCVFVIALFVAACGSTPARLPTAGGSTPYVEPAAQPTAISTTEPEPVLLATSTVEPPAAAATAPPPINPTAVPRPTLAPAAPQPTAANLPPLLTLNRRADDLDVIMTVSPARAGPNEVNFFFYDTNGDDRSIERLTARFSFLDFAVAPVAVDMVELHPGHAFLIDHQVRHAGRWRVEFAIKRAGLRDATATFELAIR